MSNHTSIPKKKGSLVSHVEGSMKTHEKKDNNKPKSDHPGSERIETHCMELLWSQSAMNQVSNEGMYCRHPEIVGK